MLRYITADARRRAVEICEAQARQLAALLPRHKLVLVGASSVVGALSRGDVDLHLGVEPDDFDLSVALLRSVYRVVHPEIWQPSLATFEIVVGEVDVGIAVTPAGSDHDDRFSSSWERLSQNRPLLDRYNGMKLTSALGDYEGCKARFFDELQTNADNARSADGAASDNLGNGSGVSPRDVT
jgi:hypothetical protein